MAIPATTKRGRAQRQRPEEQAPTQGTDLAEPDHAASPAVSR